MRFPGGKEMKNCKLKSKLSKLSSEKMPELEKHVLGFFFLLNSIFKTCAQ